MHGVNIESETVYQIVMSKQFYIIIHCLVLLDILEDIVRSHVTHCTLIFGVIKK